MNAHCASDSCLAAMRPCSDTKAPARYFETDSLENYRSRAEIICDTSAGYPFSSPRLPHSGILLVWKLAEWSPALQARSKGSGHGVRMPEQLTSFTA
jgi:hypothetical protein